MFDVPDFRVSSGIEVPVAKDVSLTAFASNDLELGKADAKHQLGISHNRLTDEQLLDLQEDVPPQAHASVTAKIESLERLKNEMSGELFGCVEAETGSGKITIVYDPVLIERDPVPGEIMSGSFWLSGSIRN